jgi:menaquinone-dependent protoporphyrinogen oxidase
MARLLIVYGSEEGQTAKIAQHMAALGRDRQHAVDLVHGKNIAGGFNLDNYDAVVVGASIHMGHHQKYMIDFAKRYRSALAPKLTAFFTVCLTAKSDKPADQAQVEQYVDEFIRATDWCPDQIAAFAGALLYSQYGLIKRWIMKSISKQTGGDLDATHDYEYTNWELVDEFADTFLTAVVGAPVLASD